MIHKILRQSTLYHNPDPLFQLIGEINESTVLPKLLLTVSQLSSISVAWVKKLKLNPQQLHSVLQIEGSRVSEVSHLVYVGACLKVPEVSAFDTDVLLLIVLYSTHTAHTPITLETLHIDMAINLATKAELESLKKQWNRGLIVTKLAMKEGQVVKHEDVKIVSQINML